MKPLKLLLATGITVCLSLQMYAQQINAKMIKEWERAKEYTKEYLDAMPEGSYGLKPTPEMRSFAGQMLHLAEANFGFATFASGATMQGKPGDLEKSGDTSKQSVTKTVMDSYDFVIDKLKNMKDAQMPEPIKLFGRFDMSREAAFEKAFEHQTHHRGQTTVYIRLAGAKPPQEKLF
ncbi:DinB family protein [Chitinophaga oryzae]|uniref:DinB family protein n=1 Tax=Chitinophaga oryzae TaxID=2725414 RepID=A0AAE7D5X6_9BACT|nr:DinB family protein [Chitinophaga oryzae]QJB30690.1 DinB family protein [Chitinophaga oryzae]QJB37190.1 DinB family protein [Chitinophaga oryzae]